MHKCYWPGCCFSTKSKRDIDFHHVTPKEIDPRPNNKVVVPLCANHHRMIWHPRSKSGHHSYRGEGHLEIALVTKSTAGIALLFKDLLGNEIWHYPES